MSDKANLDQLTLEHQHTATLLLNNKRKIIGINPAAEALLGQSARRATGKVINNVCQFLDFSALEHLDNNSGQRIIRRDLLLEQPYLPSINIDMVITPIDKNITLLELHQRKINQHELNAHSYSENFMKSIAHEVKNPLGGIRGAAQLLESELKSRELDEYTQVIIAEADRLSTLIDRMMGPSQQAVKAWLNIHEIIERAYLLIEAQSSDKIKLIRDYDVSIPDLHIDRDQLMQAVLNIARNALESLPDAGGEIIFSTRVLRQHMINNKVYPMVASVAVSDNGPGISVEHLAEIFYPMISHKPDGSGLGLSISQSLVKLNGGVLECTSRADPTCFEILLPIGQP